ncbi:MAG: pseudouridine synthase, RluA family [Candidatus Saccharibacteria bacterium]|nr:pseudouridine synthase, RluA family [Candidatus Saccharibacteria bacterium]
MTRQSLTVDEGAATERLDVYLAAALSLTRSRVLRLIQSGNVTVDGARVKAGHPLEVGESVEVELPETATFTGEPPDLPVIYEDDDIVVVDKPAGLSTHAGSGTHGRATLADFARTRSTDTDPERPGIVHRLDRDTSGLIIIARTAEAKATMQQAFAKHQVHKTYRLLAVGRVDPAEAVIRLPLDRDPAKPLRRAVIPGGREAITRYKTVETLPGYTLVEATPETGRTHQIRVHLAAIGHPIAGDTTYGPPVRPLGLKRHFLHAAALEFDTPSGRHLRLESPLPEELAKVLQTLESQV